MSEVRSSHLPSRCASRLIAAVVDAQQPGGGAAQVAAQPGLGLAGSDEFVAAPRGPGVGAVDQLLQVRDEVGADLLVALGLFGVVADHEPLGAGAVVAVAVPAGGDRDLLDPQVVGDGAVAARGGPARRRPRCWCGAASRRGCSARRRGSGRPGWRRRRTRGRPPTPAGAAPTRPGRP